MECIVHSGELKSRHLHSAGVPFLNVVYRSYVEVHIKLGGTHGSVPNAKFLDDNLSQVITLKMDDFDPPCHVWSCFPPISKRFVCVARQMF